MEHAHTLTDRTCTRIISRRLPPPREETSIVGWVTIPSGSGRMGGYVSGESRFVVRRLGCIKALLYAKAHPAMQNGLSSEGMCESGRGIKVRTRMEDLKANRQRQTPNNKVCVTVKIVRSFFLLLWLSVYIMLHTTFSITFSIIQSPLRPLPFPTTSPKKEPQNPKNGPEENTPTTKLPTLSTGHDRVRIFARLPTLIDPYGMIERQNTEGCTQ